MPGAYPDQMTEGLPSDHSGIPEQRADVPVDTMTDALTSKMPHQQPTSVRGKRTRADLVAAARKIFVRDGYPDSKIVDIARRARTSIGSFYTYFEGKEEILAAVLAEAQSDMLHITVLDEGEEHLDQIDMVIRRALTAYLTFYRDNVGLMLLIEQVAGIDPEFRKAKRERELEHIRKNTRFIAVWRDRGLADFTWDPFNLMNVLSGMISRTAYNNLAVAGESDIESIVDTCVYVWVRALGIKQ